MKLGLGLARLLKPNPIEELIKKVNRGDVVVDVNTGNLVETKHLESKEDVVDPVIDNELSQSTEPNEPTEIEQNHETLGIVLSQDVAMMAEELNADDGANPYSTAQMDMSAYRPNRVAELVQSICDTMNELSVVKTQINKKMSNVDKELSNIYHNAEVHLMTDEQAISAWRYLQDVVRTRRQVKHENELISHLESKFKFETFLPQLTNANSGVQKRYRDQQNFWDKIEDETPTINGTKKSWKKMYK